MHHLAPTRDRAEFLAEATDRFESKREINDAADLLLAAEGLTLDEAKAAMARANIEKLPHDD